MLKKLALLLFLVSSLGFELKTSAIDLETAIYCFRYGYVVGVNPLLWSRHIPYMIRQIPDIMGKQNEFAVMYESRATSILNLIGLTTGVAVLAVAAYGAKKLIENIYKKNEQEHAGNYL